MHIQSLIVQVKGSSLCAVEMVKKKGTDSNFKVAESLIGKKIRNTQSEMTRLREQDPVKRYFEFSEKMAMAQAFKSRGNSGDKAIADKLFKEAINGAYRSGHLGVHGYIKPSSVERLERLTESLSKYERLAEQLFNIRNEQVENSVAPRSGNGSAVMGAHL